MIRGIIFDLDGTLVDSMGCWAETDRKFLLENNIKPPSDISDVMKTLSMREAAEYFIHLGVKMRHDDITRRIEEIIADEYANKTELKPGVTELLDYLDSKGIVYCVATANYKSLAEAVLKNYDIFKRFKSIITSEEINIKKDKPEFFIETVKRLGLNIEETIVVDDALHCLESSVKSGFFTVAVFDDASSSKWKESVNVSNLAVNSLGEFTQFLKNNEKDGGNIYELR